MTVVNVQAAMMERMVKPPTQGKGDEQAVAPTVQGKEASFSDVMAKQNQPVSTSKVDAVKQSEKKAAVKDSPKSMDTTVVGKTDSKVSQSATDTKKDKVNTDKASNKELESNDQDVEQIVKDEEVDEEVLSALQSTLKDSMTELQNILGISEEELNQLMDQSGFTATDLLDPNNLQSLILNQFGAENITDALVNEPLANALQQSIKALDNVTEQFATILNTEEVQLPPEVITALEEQLTPQTAVTNGKPGKLDPETVKTEVEVTPISDEVSRTVDVVVKKEQSSFHEQNAQSGLGEQRDRNETVRTNETKTDFVDYFSSRVEQVSVDSVNQPGEVVEVRNIITQIVDQIKVNISQTETSMEMLLNPENLGHVQLVVAHKEGVMTAHFTVQNQVTKEALESSMNTLKESFEEQGLKVSDVEVTVGNYSDGFTRDNEHGQAAGQQNAKPKGHLRGFSYEEDTEEATAAETVRTNYNGTVEYTA